MNWLALFLLLAGTLWGGENRFVPVQIKGRLLNAEVADTLEKQTRGLMYRSEISESFAMLFPYGTEDTRSFWMKNTWIALDIIFLNRQRQVVDIAANVPPCRQDPCPIYTSRLPAQYVLEIRAGLSATWGLRVGDTVFFTID